ncbi:hypothetical protein DAEQUDRAFT_258426 [Daedalea quercina L-15889]|uniref:Uncharacterized protein n=1 Tax=Daedalea quercina L-15889 TaxID=1314783 RepID=A0A165QK13_9APHY|nr:hypothetical protein DAEQUDRAFT_258426 [Daedalea quercina L-15889]
MKRAYEKLRKNVRLQKPGGETVLQEFKDERFKYVEAVTKNKHASEKECNEWLPKQLSYLRSERFDQLVECFIKLGYDVQDAHAIQASKESKLARKVTEREWKAIMPTLRTLIEMERYRRPCNECGATIIQRRKAIVKNAYDNYQRTLRAMEWTHLPPPQMHTRYPSISPSHLLRIERPAYAG